MSWESTADTFDLVGEESRMAIVRALLETRRSSEDPHVRFTDLRDRAGIEDTGRFNYHLGELLGTFVTKDEAGYRLTGLGHRLLAPMVAGVADAEAAFEALEVPGECPKCGTPLRLRAGEAKLQVACEEGHAVNRGLLGYPNVLADRESEDAVAALGLLNTQGIELAVEGVCPVCHGRVDGRVSPPSAAPEATEAHVFRAPCGTCGNQFATTVGSCVATHPAVVAFLHDHGVDARRAVPWALEFRQAGAETVLSEDPLRLRVDVEVGEETLSLVVDGAGSVVSTERTGSAGGDPD